MYSPLPTIMLCDISVLIIVMASTKHKKTDLKSVLVQNCIRKVQKASLKQLGKQPVLSYNFMVLRVPRS